MEKFSSPRDLLPDDRLHIEHAYYGGCRLHYALSPHARQGCLVFSERTSGQKMSAKLLNWVLRLC